MVIWICKLTSELFISEIDFWFSHWAVADKLKVYGCDSIEYLQANDIASTKGYIPFYISLGLCEHNWSVNHAHEVEIQQDYCKILQNNTDYSINFNK